MKKIIALFTMVSIIMALFPASMAFAQEPIQTKVVNGRTCNVKTDTTSLNNNISSNPIKVLGLGGIEFNLPTGYKIAKTTWSSSPIVSIGVCNKYDEQNFYTSTRFLVNSTATTDTSLTVDFSNIGTASSTLAYVSVIAVAPDGVPILFEQQVDPSNLLGAYNISNENYTKTTFSLTGANVNLNNLSITKRNTDTSINIKELYSAFTVSTNEYVLNNQIYLKNGSYDIGADFGSASNEYFATFNNATISQASSSLSTSSTNFTKLNITMAQDFKITPSNLNIFYKLEGGAKDSSYNGVFIDLNRNNYVQMGNYTQFEIMFDFGSDSNGDYFSVNYASTPSITQSTTGITIGTNITSWLDLTNYNTFSSGGSDYIDPFFKDDYGNKIEIYAEYACLHYVFENNSQAVASLDLSPYSELQIPNIIGDFDLSVSLNEPNPFNSINAQKSKITIQGAKETTLSNAGIATTLNDSIQVSVNISNLETNSSNRLVVAVYNQEGVLIGLGYTNCYSDGDFYVNVPYRGADVLNKSGNSIKCMLFDDMNNIKPLSRWVSFSVQ